MASFNDCKFGSFYVLGFSACRNSFVQQFVRKQKLTPFVSRELPDQSLMTIISFINNTVVSTYFVLLISTVTSGRPSQSNGR